ncbi:MAG: cobalt-precorrin 5A hydrolase [Clostridia bacterium]|nr:cobalt-precorrin 5A hydrolase [Clostridia bacterium]
MSTAVIALTKNGSALAVRIGEELKAHIYLKKEWAEFYKASTSQGMDVFPIEAGLNDLAASLFKKYRKLVFIMACGIVVRSIAPLLKDKKNDPAVVVMDEKGQYAVSLLSGHLGGANELARKLSLITGGQPVITTATDVNHVISLDVFAQSNGCVIENFEDLKVISSALVNGEEVPIYSDAKIQGLENARIISQDNIKMTSCNNVVMVTNRLDLDVDAQNTLWIRPKNLIVGIGCRKGISKEKIESAFWDFLDINKKSKVSVKWIATIDIKKDEKGILEFCREHHFPLKIIEQSEILKVENQYEASRFVKEKIGVSSVAEPCAVLAGTNAKLICPKTKYEGITLALSEEEMFFSI